MIILLYEMTTRNVKIKLNKRLYLNYCQLDLSKLMTEANINWKDKLFSRFYCSVHIDETMFLVSFSRTSHFQAYLGYDLCFVVTCDDLGILFVFYFPIYSVIWLIS